MKKIIRISKIIRYSLNTIISILLSTLFLFFIIVSGFKANETGDLTHTGYNIFQAENTSLKIDAKFEVMNTQVSFDYLSDNRVKASVMFTLISLSFVSFFIYFHLKSLFLLYEKGKIFTLENTKHLKLLSFGILLAGALNVINSLNLWLAVSRIEKVPISLTQVFPIYYILIGLVAYSISLVMEEAQKINEENEMVI